MNSKIWKIALRNILKNKLFSAVNIVGLTVGFVGFMIVALFIRYELTWDSTHENYDQIYRVQEYKTNAVNTRAGNNISPHTLVITASLIEQNPEFEKVSVIREEEGKFLSVVPETQFYDETGIIADHNFLDIFSCNFTEGNQTEALSAPFSIVLSQSMADKLFKDEKALGQNVVYEKKLNFKVTGVFQDLPKNSTIRPAYILSFTTLRSTQHINRNESWQGNVMTYALLKPGTNVDVLEVKIKDAYKEFKRRDFVELQLCPLSKIYLGFNGQKDLYIMLFFIGLIALFILIMSAFNYVNFTIATSSTRGKEVAVRKLVGAGRLSLATQFQVETLLLTLAASTFALFMVKMLLPIYNTFVDADITMTFVDDWKVILGLILSSIIIGLLSGIYPSKVMTSKKIVKLIKEGMFSSAGSKFDLKKVLVALQFTISIFLICFTLFMVTQVNYMATKDLGFDRHNLLFTKLTTENSNKYFEPIKNRLLQHPEILSASMSSNLPFVSMNGGMLNWEGSDPTQKTLYRSNYVTKDFIENMDLKLIQGRNFSDQYAADYENSCIINESARKVFNWDNPIGKRIKDKKWTIIGVVDDYHLADIHNPIDPAVLLLSSGKIEGELTFAFRYSNGNLSKVKQILRDEFNALFPNDPFEFNNLESAIQSENSFKIYQKIKKSILFFTVFIVILTIVALLGMVSYTTSRRTKEIGVRKINGSTVKNIFFLLNRTYFVLLGIALVIAIPLAYALYNALPGNFKIAPPVWMPFFAAFLILIIIFLSTGYQTLKAATRNPVEALRYE